MQKVDLSDFLALTAVVISGLSGMCSAAGDDDTDFYSRVYYTPDELRMVQAVLRAQGPMLENLKYDLRYAIGPAWERGANEKIVHNGSLSLRYETSDTVELGMLVGFSDTPTYGNEYVSVNLEYRF